MRTRLSNFYFDNNLKLWIAKPQAVFSWFQHWVEEYKKAENYVAKEIRWSSYNLVVILIIMVNNTFVGTVDPFDFII